MCSYNCTSTYFNPKWVCHPHLFLLLQLQFKKKLCAQIAQQVIHKSMKVKKYKSINPTLLRPAVTRPQSPGQTQVQKAKCIRKLMAFPNQKTFPHPKLHPVSNQNFHHGSSSSCAAGPVDRTSLPQLKQYHQCSWQLGGKLVTAQKSKKWKVT